MKSNSSTYFAVAGVFLALGYHALYTTLSVFQARAVPLVIFLYICAVLCYITGILSENPILRWVGFWISFVYLFAVLLALVVHVRTDYPFAVHDGVTQIEAAENFLLAGKNPYSMVYDAAFAGQPNIRVLDQTLHNPAIYHFISLPFHLLIGIPFQYSAQMFFHWFDFRVVHWTFGFGLMVYVALRNSIADWKRQLWITLTFLNPLFLPFFLEGRNDIVVFSLLSVSLFCLHDKQYRWSALLLALACVTKMTAWFSVPFFAVYAFRTRQLKLITTIELRKVIIIGVVVALSIILPFLVWSPHDFIDDIFLYPTGMSAHSYPINGYSLPATLYSLEIIQHVTDPFALWPLMLGICFPLLALLLYVQSRHYSVAQIASFQAVFLLVFWLCSRFFNDNYVGYIVLLFLLAWLLASNETEVVDHV